jgi:hypothetical protein
MTNKQLNFLTMAESVRKLLADARPRWEPLYKKMVPDVEALGAALGQAGTQV